MTPEARSIISDECVKAIRSHELTPEEGLIAAIFPPAVVVEWAEEKVEEQAAKKARSKELLAARREREYAARRHSRATSAAYRARENEQREARRAS